MHICSNKDTESFLKEKFINITNTSWKSGKIISSSSPSSSIDIDHNIITNAFYLPPFLESSILKDNFVHEFQNNTPLAFEAETPTDKITDRIPSFLKNETNSFYFDNTFETKPENSNKFQSNLNTPPILPSKRKIFSENNDFAIPSH